MHNATFDLSFLNYELKLLNKSEINKEYVVDTLEIARTKYPGSQNSLDALCKRFNIDNSKRAKHSALVDCNLLKEVYVNLLDQKEPKLNLENAEIMDLNLSNISNKNINISKKIIKPTEKELKLHHEFLKKNLPKNYYR